MCMVHSNSKWLVGQKSLCKYLTKSSKLYSAGNKEKSDTFIISNETKYTDTDRKHLIKDGKPTTDLVMACAIRGLGRNPTDHHPCDSREEDSNMEGNSGEGQQCGGQQCRRTTV